MRANAALLLLTICFGVGEVRAKAEGPERKCPVVINGIELNYNHQGGPSRPQLTIEFENHAGKRISKVVFRLYVLGVGGYPRPYLDDLTYQAAQEVLESGKKKEFMWALTPEAVDIHRTGETVVVKKVDFSDTTDWIDDGSETCVFTVDFHAR
jgi:hypothetical protein